MPVPECVVPDDQVARAGLDGNVVIPVAQVAVLDRHVLARRRVDPVRVGTVRGRGDVDPLYQDVSRVLGNEVEHGTVSEVEVVDVNVSAVGYRQEERCLDAAVLLADVPPDLTAPIDRSHPSTVDGEVIAVLEVEESFVLRPHGGVVGGYDRPGDKKFHVDALPARDAEGPYEVCPLRDVDSVVTCVRGAEEERLQEGLRVVGLAIPDSSVVGNAAGQLSEGDVSKHGEEERNSYYHDHSLPVGIIIIIGAACATCV